MLLRLFLLFTIIPAIELYLLLLLGQHMGALATVALILFTGAVGSYMAKREGLSMLQQLQQDAQKGIPPANRLVEGLLVLIGGVLLITPGVLTDVVGFSLIFPATRQMLAPLVRQAVMKRVTVQAAGGGFQAGFGPMRDGPRQQAPRAPQSEDGGGGEGPFDHPVS
jgi:UPF0716 protein FxsA